MAAGYNENSIADLVKEMVKNMSDSGTTQVAAKPNAQAPRQSVPRTEVHDKPLATSHSNGLTSKDYPLAEKHPELLKTQRGKLFSDVTLANAIDGNVVNEDIKISPEVLEYQAQIAESTGKIQLAENFRRAAELASIPDDMVLKIYNMLRPNRSTKRELEDLAQQLRTKYNAPGNAKLVEEAVGIYEKRGILVNG